MYQRLPIDRVALTKLLNTPAVIRIVTILDITSLSILELFEYDISIGDIIYSMVNGVITYDNSALASTTEERLFSIPTNPPHYYAFVRRTVKLTDLGIYILESLKGERSERRSSGEFQDELSNTNPRHPSSIA